MSFSNTTYISVESAHHEIIRAKLGQDGISLGIHHEKHVCVSYV